MKISGIIYDSVVDGIGIRNVVFVSGCKHKCSGCHNKESWDFNNGIEFTIEKQLEFIKKCKYNPILDGITLSGGDPMFSEEDVLSFIKLYKQHCPAHSIWIYSGFTYEELILDPLKREVLNLCDVLVDGRYEQELRNTTLPFRGSSNQRIIKLRKCDSIM